MIQGAIELKAKRIQELNLQGIRKKVLKTEGWNQVNWRAAQKKYKNFLHTILYYPPGNERRIKIEPSWDVDVIWRAHMSRRKKYVAACQKIFGRVIERIVVDNKVSYN